MFFLVSGLGIDKPVTTLRCAVLYGDILKRKLLLQHFPMSIIFYKVHINP